MMPPFPIIDAHVHLYDPKTFDFPWMAGVPPLNAPHGPAEFDAAAAQACVAVDGLVFVEVDVAPGRHVDEAAWVARLAEREPRIRAIVASCPLEDGDAAAADLERLAALPLVRGVRRLLQDEPDPEFCLRPGFLDGLRLLPRHGLCFDVCVRHHQVKAATEMVRRCPDVSFVLDHLGKPPVAAGGLDPWRADLKALAELPNVVCKLSGLVTEADPERWEREDLKPYIDHAVDCFGFGRLMYGGDWPVSTLAGGYAAWLDALLWAVEGASEDETRRLFRGTAKATYRPDAARLHAEGLR